MVSGYADTKDRVGRGQVVCCRRLQGFWVHQGRNARRLHAAPRHFLDPNGCGSILVQKKSKARVDFLPVEFALPARIPWWWLEAGLLAVPDHCICPGFLGSGKFLASQLPQSVYEREQLRAVLRELGPVDQRRDEALVCGHPSTPDRGDVLGRVGRG